MKIIQTMSIDEDLVKEARNRKINISGTINSLLREFLKPKKADFKAEDLTLNIIEFGKSFNLYFKTFEDKPLEFTPDMAVFTHENLHIDAIASWRNLKETYNSNLNLYDYMEIRKKFKEKFLIQKIEEIS